MNNIENDGINSVLQSVFLKRFLQRSFQVRAAIEESNNRFFAKTKNLPSPSPVF
ncbi:MAG: hypothetical protein ACE5I1_07870 [bacterium]